MPNAHTPQRLAYESVAKYKLRRWLSKELVQLATLSGPYRGGPRGLTVTSDLPKPPAVLRISTVLKGVLNAFHR